METLLLILYSGHSSELYTLFFILTFFMDITFLTRKFQKSMASFSILAMLASLVSFTGVASAETFPDVDSDHWAYDYVDEISDAEIMTGYDDGDFGVDDVLTRDQATKILVLAFLGEDAVDVDADAGFSDVSSSNSLEDYINTAADYVLFLDANGKPVFAMTN